ncbi:HoxN/HupN/NixA family nickel/cobalt transporter [Cellulomonas sp. NPDC055163]
MTTALPPLRQGRRPLTRDERRSVAAMVAVVAALHVVGWGVLLGVVAPERYRLGDGQLFGLGLGVTAYVLGMRHAFDADHIAAIDSTTRSMMAAGRRPLSVGFWFSLGHSSIVLGLCLLLALGARALVGPVQDEGSVLHQVTGTIGTSVSAGFLLLVGLVNLVLLRQVVGVARRLRRGEADGSVLAGQLAPGGLLARVLAPVTRRVVRPRRMYVVGLLFGLGFDTATEVSLLALAGGAAVFDLPWYALLTLPVLFAAGMSLLDTADGCFMSVAYGWALDRPVRTVRYSIVVTALSVVVALGIGGVEVAQIVGERSQGRLWAWVEGVDLGAVGYAVVVTFVVVWLVALGVRRAGRDATRDGERTGGAGPAA